jgi:TolB-like protein
MSGDPEQQYFADGITEDLTTDLSRIADMLVISRNSAFTYKDKPINAKQIGRELNVRYVLEGSIRRSGDRVRANAQLIDAETDAHLWAERFDRAADDLFALQDEVTSRIAVALNLELVAAEAARPTDHPDALDFILRGRALSSQTTENYAEAIRFYERALTLDPQSVEAQALLARTLAARAMDGLTNSAEADITRAERLVWQALAASPRSPLAHYARGQVLRAQGSYSRIRDGACVQSQLGGGTGQYRSMQIPDWLDRGGNHRPGASNPPQPARSPAWHLVSPNRSSASAAIAHR